MRASTVVVLAIVLLGCSRERSGELRSEQPGKPGTSTPIEPAPRSDTPTPELMAHHFEQGVSARDALVRGDLDAARAAARELAELAPTADMPRLWAPHLDAMRAEARSLAGAGDLDGAALELGDLAASCGSCHSQVGAEVTMTVPSRPAGDDLTSHMREHQWAADRLWEGLVIPDAARFTAGAGVLAGAPLHPSAILPDRSPPPEIDALAREVHELGRSASLATDDPARARLYGELVRTCADCHSRLGTEE